MSIAKFRFESGSVYVYDAKYAAYVFVGKLNGRTKAQFMADYNSCEQWECGQ